MNHGTPPPGEIIQLTRPLLPPLDEYLPYLKKIWANQWLTNYGELHTELEIALRDHLCVPQLSLFANGTLALMAAIKALNLNGEVITTPFTFPATTHALHWCNLTPVFADIDPDTMCLSPDAIERAITPRTSAIVPVHVFGIPCDVERIQAIALKYKLKIIYDAAHAFGVKIGQTSILRYGDYSMLSFHATKLFTTVEGGAVVSQSAAEKTRLDLWRNFGISDEVTVTLPGLNAKMSEPHAAFGLLQLRYLTDIISQRAAIHQRYHTAFAGIPGLRLLTPPPNVSWNYAYYALRVTPDFKSTRNELFARLRSAGIMARRYFYPLVSDTPPYKSRTSALPENLIAARTVADQVLCLPIYAGLTHIQQDRVIDVVVSAGR